MEIKVAQVCVGRFHHFDLLYMAVRIQSDLGVAIVLLLAPRKDDWERVLAGLAALGRGPFFVLGK